MKRDLIQRSREAELMDDPKVSKETLQLVLRDINRANRILGGNRITLKALARLVRQYPRKEYLILDVGCGDGTLLREVVLFFRGVGLPVKAIGVDLNAYALEIAREASLNFPEITYKNEDILDAKRRVTECDILLTTLTLHHFHDETIPFVLERFHQMARIGVVINDLQRSAMARALYKVFRRIFIHSEIAKNDGLVSIERGFTKVELMRFSKNIFGTTHEIRWRWAFRYVWIMTKNRLKAEDE